MTGIIAYPPPMVSAEIVKKVQKTDWDRRGPGSRFRAVGHAGSVAAGFAVAIASARTIHGPFRYRGAPHGEGATGANRFFLLHSRRVKGDR